MDIIAIRGVMTAQHVINMSRDGLIVIDQSRVVRIDPDKMFTPTPEVAEAFRNMITEPDLLAALKQLIPLAEYAPDEMG